MASDINVLVLPDIVLDSGFRILFGVNGRQVRVNIGIIFGAVLMLRSAFAHLTKMFNRNQKLHHLSELLI